MIALLSGSCAHAQGAGGAYALKATPNNGYGGGNFVPTNKGAKGTSAPYAWTLNNGAPGYYGGTGVGPGASGDSVSVTGSGTLSATFVWSPASIPPPSAVVVHQQCNVSGHSAGSVNGFSYSGDAGMGTGFAADKYTLVTNPGASFSISATDGLSPTVTASGTVALNGSGAAEAQVVYTATASPITINLTGPAVDVHGNLILDGSGNPHILIGQQCSATLSGIPTGTGWSSSPYKWSVTGKTVLGNCWVIATGDTSASFSGFVSPYTFTQATQQAAGPSWYWDDSTTSQTVTCTTTVTPPTGQGAAFTVTATQKVMLDSPTFTNKGIPGTIYLDTKYIGVSGLALHAGAEVVAAPAIPVPGMTFSDTVTTPFVPSIYSDTGRWWHLQLITVSKYRTGAGGTTAVGSLGNKLPGALDAGPEDAGGVTFIYGATFAADGKDGASVTETDSPDNDSPGFLVDTAYQEYNVKAESFHDYIMYLPSGSNSIVVPVADYTWSWNVDVKTPPAWTAQTGAVTAGTITPPKTATRQLTHPTWSYLRNLNWPTN